MRHEDFIKTLKSDPYTNDFYRQHGYNEEQKKLLAVWGEIDADKKAGKEILNIPGAYSPEEKGSDAYGYFIRPEEGGTYLKIYGCSYLYKGLAPKETVEGLQLSKALLFSDIPRDIIGRSWLLSLAIGCLFIFRRKKFIILFDKLMVQIDWKVVRHYDIPPHEYNELEKEIDRAATLSLQGAWEKPLKKFIRFVKLFLFSDNTYRLRLQDALGEGKDFWGTLDTLIERETSVGVPYKWRFIKTAMKIALFTSPALKRTITTFFENLDREKVKLDESDWYWSLKFNSYNFGGLDKKTRHALRDKIDKEKGHIFLL